MIDAKQIYKNNIALLNEVKQLINTSLEKFNSRFLGYEDNEIVAQAALLDPRFKKIAFNGYHPRKLEITIEL